MGSWTLVIHGTRAHHNFKELGPSKLVPDGEGDYERHCNDSNYMAARFVRDLKSKGQNVTAAEG